MQDDVRCDTSFYMQPSGSLALTNLLRPHLISQTVLNGTLMHSLATVAFLVFQHARVQGHKPPTEASKFDGVTHADAMGHAEVVPTLA